MAYGLDALTNRTSAAEEALGFLRSVVAAASRPANLLAVLFVLLGWAALIAWTGNGPGGWQARTCAGLGLASRACAEVLPSKDQSRVAPHDAGSTS
ncbi:MULTISPECIES: hypothetical protein [unclassified Methylobacterium]|jgi:hypothetical protein|uniref:hypothetical protein n=1 Tax=unclassified Methylobacterium TaxID=2615210 RepID=UPI000691DC58|nr:MULTISPECIES: hypothetical protein [unclassified Methylobacterium]MDE4909533.1 hypothetical protein [Methylobacterium sp. 092160098-2]SFU93093.1 hypothetical protein SAMN02799643_03259 [Methylobacterium sp. UNCCL125]